MRAVERVERLDVMRVREERSGVMLKFRVQLWMSFGEVSGVRKSIYHKPSLTVAGSSSSSIFADCLVVR